MISQKIITGIVTILLIVVLSTIYYRIFSLSIRKILSSIVRILGFWTILLVVNRYYPTFTTPSIVLSSIVIWSINKQYSKSFRTLSLILIAFYTLNYSWLENIIISIWIVVWVEEIIKSTWIVTHKESRLPYDAILSWMLLGSFFWVFEAWWAWWVNSLSQVRMRISSTISIHTLTTITILWLWVYVSSKSTYNSKKVIWKTILWVLLAYILHWAYNYFQFSSLVTVSIVLASYVGITYRISKIDRILL